MSLGLEIVIEKVQDGGTDVEYSFRVDAGRGGLVLANATGRPGYARISKSTGEVRLQSPCPDDEDGAIFGRVAVVLARHWRAGEYPSVTWWAA